jgi:hypothetical protein
MWLLELRARHGVDLHSAFPTVRNVHHVGRIPPHQMRSTCPSQAPQSSMTSMSLFWPGWPLRMTEPAFRTTVAR